MVLTLRLRFLLSFTGALLATTALFLVTTPQHHTHLLHFWHYDLPPFPPSLRILGYSGVLLIALISYISRPPFGDSPVQAPELYRFTLPSFFSLEGAMALFGGKWLTYERLRLIRGVMVVSWLLCIVGGGGWVARVVCGVCMFVLHGVVSGCIGTSHRWYVPVYTLLALMAADGNYEHSLDNWLHDRYPHVWPFHSTFDSSSFLHTGFARKLILLSSIATLFYGGITKILNGGWKWLNGRSLAYYVSSEENGRSVLLKKLMHTQPVLSFFLAVSSIVLECGAVLALWDAWWRPIILANAAAFHFGIWLTMWPNYAPQTFCYGLGTRWWWEADPHYHSPIPRSMQHSQQPMWELLADGHTLPDYLTSSVFLSSWCAMLLAVFLTFITLFRIEYWPFTGIPMYSFYRDNSFSYRFLRDEQQAQGVAIEHVQSGYPNALAWSNLWIILRLKNTAPHVKAEIAEYKRRWKAERDSNKPASTLAAERAERRAGRARGGGQVLDDPDERWYVNLKNRVTRDSATYGVLTKQWRRTLHNVAAEDMAAKPHGRIHAPKEGEEARIEAEESEGDVTEGEEAAAATETKEEGGSGGAGDEADDEQDDSATSTTGLRSRSTTKPIVNTRLSSRTPSPRASPRTVYPGEEWLIRQRDTLRRYAAECDWQLPQWCDATGELQLRCKLKHGYAVIARCPWNPAQSK